MGVLSLCNARTGHAIAGTVEFALTRQARRRGLLGRHAIDASAALILSPCKAIHTAFMRFPIDVVFLDGQWRVLRIVFEMPPWRAAIAAGAAAVIELPSGSLRTRDVAVGDGLFLASTSNSTTSNSWLRTRRFRGMLARLVPCEPSEILIQYSGGRR